MPITAGTRLGPYEIASALGAGGMGEVYRARDIRLNRTVAVKVLPAYLADDPKALARFQREAEALAALSHPNVMAIHDVGRADDVSFLVMELLEGETLRQRLARPPFPLRKALDVAVQIADGLSAAHGKGVLHRDLKPENVFVITDGQIKLLDFGLAKAPAPISEATVETAGPTYAANTDPGVVMGTAGYMSPEQAQGRPIDHRSDIFSFGSILYELVVGRRAFEGDSAIDTLHRVVYAEPAPVSSLIPNAPLELQRIIRKCLAKDPEERYQSVKDLGIDLRDFRREVESGAHVQTTGITADSRTPGDGTLLVRLASRPWAWALVGIAGAVAITVVALIWIRQDRTGSQIEPQRPPTITRITATGTVIDAAVSPDGNYLTYVVSEAGQHSLWLRQIAGASSVQLRPPAPVGYWGITFSPDGRSIFYSLKGPGLHGGALFEIPTLGGTPRKILEGIDSVVSFSPDARRITYLRADSPAPGESSLMVGNIDGSSVRALATRRPPEFVAPIFFGAPSWSPDGRLIACPVRRQGVRRGAGILLFHTDDGTEQPFISPEWTFVGHVEWLHDGRTLVAIGTDAVDTRAEQLWLLPYPAGRARRLTNDLFAYRKISLTANDASLG